MAQQESQINASNNLNYDDYAAIVGGLYLEFSARQKEAEAHYSSVIRNLESKILSLSQELDKEKKDNNEERRER